MESNSSTATPTANPTPAFSGRRLITAALLVLTTLLVAAEIGLRIAFSIDPVFEFFSGYDAPSQRIDWVRNRRRGQSFVYSFDRYDNLRGWAVTPNLRDLPVFDDKTLSTNSRGLRGTAEYAFEPDSGVTRIAVFGDSFTFGDEVSDNETWAHLLGQKDPQTEVLNMGVHGYGIDQALQYLRTEGVRYHPDVVVLGFVWFDIHRDLFDFTNFAKPRATLDEGRLVWENTPVPSPEDVLRREFFRLKVADFANMVVSRIRWLTGAYDREAEVLATSLLDEFAETARLAGARPVFAYLPVLKETLDTTAGLTENEIFLDGYCATHDVDCFFFRQEYAREAVRLGLTDTTRHWTADGHRIVADLIWDFLKPPNATEGDAAN